MGREVGGGGVFSVGGADEEAEGVGLNAVGDEGVVGGGFKDDGDSGGGLADVGREGLEGALDDAVGAGRSWGKRMNRKLKIKNAKLKSGREKKTESAL